MSENKNKVDKLREDIIDRTSKNIPTEVHEDYVKTQIRIALNNYAVPFEKKIDELTKSRDTFKAAFQDMTKKYTDEVKEVERLKKLIESICGHTSKNITYADGKKLCFDCGIELKEEVERLRNKNNGKCQCKVNRMIVRHENKDWCNSCDKEIN